MSNQQAAAQAVTLSALLVLLQEEESSAAKELRKAHERHRKASEELAATQSRYVLATIEAARLEALAKAAACLEQREYHLAEAERHTRAYMIRSTPAGYREAAA